MENKKSIIILIGIVVLAFLLIGKLFTGNAKTPVTEAACFEFDKEKGEITEYKSICDDEVNIPKKIKGTKVKSIGSFAFSKKGIKKLILLDGLKEIGIGAFEGNLIKK